jgi:hypothetical protein
MVNRFPAADEGRTADNGNSAADVDPVRRQFNAERSHDKEWHGLLRSWRALGIRLPRLRVEASRYVAARVDLLKSKVSRAAEGAVIGVVAGIIGLAVIATAAVLTVVGIAGGIAQALDGSAWAGNLLTGGGLLVLLIGAVLLGIGRKRAARLKRLEQRYAEFDRASAVPPGDLPSVPPNEPARANGAVP